VTLVPGSGSDIEFILRGRSLLYTTNNRGIGIDHCGTPCFNVPQSEKSFLVVIGDFTSTFCLQVVK
jgi:hypothetical protein